MCGECGRGDANWNPLAVDGNHAAVAQAFEVFLTGERAVGGADVILGLGPARRRAHGMSSAECCPPPWERGRPARTSIRATPVPVARSMRARRPRSQGGG